MMKNTKDKAIEAARTMAPHILPEVIAAKVETGLVSGDSITMGSKTMTYKGDNNILVTAGGTELFNGPASADQLDQLLVVVAAKAGCRGVSIG